MPRAMTRVIDKDGRVVEIDDHSNSSHGEATAKVFLLKELSIGGKHALIRDVKVVKPNWGGQDEGFHTTNNTGLTSSN